MLNHINRFRLRISLKFSEDTFIWFSFFSPLSCPPLWQQNCNQNTIHAKHSSTSCSNHIQHNCGYVWPQTTGQHMLLANECVCVCVRACVYVYVCRQNRFILRAQLSTERLARLCSRPHQTCNVVSSLTYNGPPFTRTFMHDDCRTPVITRCAVTTRNIHAFFWRTHALTLAWR